MAATRADFGATVDGVRNHVPQLDITNTSQPSVSDVEHYLEVVSARVAARIGRPLPSAADTPDEYEWAQGLVELGAAAYAQTAGFPERAGEAGDSYGQILWDRFLSEVDEFLESRGESTGGGAGAERATHDIPLASFPPPLWRRDTAF